MSNCTICGFTALTQFQAKEWMFRLGDEYQYEFCPQCRCIQLLNRTNNPSKLYPENYYSFSRNVQALYSSPWGKKRLKLLKKQFRREGAQLKNQPVLELLKELRVSKETRIADIGCGEGELLYLLRELGFSNAEGFDPFISAHIRYSNGLEIKKMDLFEIKCGFDLIMLNHSFEHMENPLQVLKKLRDLMRNPESRLLIRVPVVNRAWNLFGPYWYQLDPPRHLHLCSIEGMNLLLEKADLIVEKTVFDSTEAQIFLSEKNFY